jgi:hypothetical protein
MGMRVLQFVEDHPDPSPGFNAVVARLRERMERVRQLGIEQVDGRSEERVATKRKLELRHEMRRTHLDHLTSVATVASIDDPELIQKFTFPRNATRYRAFQAVASNFAAEAESRKELLLKHGLSEEVLSGLKVSLDEFEAMVEKGAAGRLAHVAATAELNTIGEEVVQIVKIMNGLIRVRYANQEQVLAAWVSASGVAAPPKPEAKPESGTTTPPADVRPAV